MLIAIYDRLSISKLLKIKLSKKDLSLAKIFHTILTDDKHNNKSK